MKKLIFSTLVFALAGCSASVGPVPTPVLLPTLAPMATATPNVTLIQVQTEQRRIDADLERIRIEATATAAALNMQAQQQNQAAAIQQQQQVIDATVTAQTMQLQQQNAVIEATAQAHQAEQQRRAEATSQAIQATDQARSAAAQATADARFREQQITAQQGQALATQAQAQRDMYLFVALAAVALGAIACTGFYIWQRNRVDLAQVHTGNYLPRPTTIIGDGKIIRVHSQPNAPGLPPNWAVMQATAAANGHLLTFKDGIVTMTDQSGNVIKQRRLNGPRGGQL